MPPGLSWNNPAETTSSPTGFRPDIQGLRALAVISVVLFHLRVSAFGGGYAGVDIFFVISGYLITRNILSDLQAGRFTFRNFYARRICRIFPAMLATVAITMVAGVLWFPPSKFLALAQSSLASLSFVSNVYFWRSLQDYFSPDSGFSPLLHLWSLSVEEQFYIFWPLVMLCFANTRAARLVLYGGIIGLASFVLGFLFRKIDPSGVFYLVPFRVYQFALGALALFAERSISPNAVIRRVAQVAGLVLCLVGILGFTSHAGLAASFGAALLIYGGTTRLSFPVLDNVPAIYIGKISYSLYLVHWPVAVFANYIVGEKVFSPAGIAIQLGIVLVGAASMYRFVERPFLSAHKAPERKLHVRPLLAVSVALIVISATAMVDAGWPWRLDPARQRVDQLEAFGVAPCMREATDCIFGAANVAAPAAMLIGDSYAQHYVSGFNKIAAGLGLRVQEHIAHGCLVLSGLTRLGYPQGHCQEGSNRVLAAMKNSSAPVIISEAWMGYRNGSIGDDAGHPIDVRFEDRRLDVLRQGLERTIRDIARPGRRILIIGAQVMAPCDFTPARLGLGLLPHERSVPCAPHSREDARRATAGMDAMLAKVRDRHPGTVSLLLPVDYICDATCPITDKGIWLYQDAGHLTVAGSLRFAERANNGITRFLLEGSGSRNGSFENPAH